jgi:hypothetical protein
VQIRRLPNKDSTKSHPVLVIFGLDRDGFLLYEVVPRHAPAPVDNNDDDDDDAKPPPTKKDDDGPTPKVAVELPTQAIASVAGDNRVA